MKNTMESAGRNSKAVALKVDNGEGGFYRFTAEEVEAMKHCIMVHIDGDGSAWRLRICLEGEAFCCARGEREKAKRVRKIALYNALTDGKDMPKWSEDSEPQEEHFARFNEADWSIIPDGEPIKEDHGYAIPQPTDNGTTGEGCNYYIAIYNRKGEEIHVVCPTWYGISEDKMHGLCIGLKCGYNHRTAEVRAYEMDENGNKGRLIYRLGGR